MSYLVLEDFKGGLDTRKARLAAPAGTLTEALDGHITPGGEFEKRAAFVALDNPDSAETDSLPPNTFGLQPVAGGLMVFGSMDPTGLQWPDDADGNAISYQRLQHPAVLAGETYVEGSHGMEAVIASEVFGGKAWVAARFKDGRAFCYYDGALVADFTAGRVLPYLAGNNRKIASHMKGLVDALDRYSAALVGPYTTTHRAHAGTTATLTIGAHGFQIADKVWVTGMSANYNAAGVAITGITATTISYTTGSLTEGTTADTSGTVEAAVINIDGGSGVDYGVEANNTTSAGTVTGPTNTVSPVAPVTGVEARGSFTVTGGSANGITPTAATGTVTRTATNALSGDYIQIGKRKYTFRTTLSVEGDVKIGAAASDTLTNLKNAINHTGTAGTDYVCALPHPWVRAGNISGSNLPLTAFHGSHGNSLSLIESTGTVRYSVTAFSGGAGNCVGSIKVVSPTGTEVEILSAAVAFTINASATAAAVRDNIAAYSGTSGYTATVNENTVTILSSDTATPMPNGYHVQVATGGDVLIGECLFYLTQQTATFVINTILVDGLDCLGGAESYPDAMVIDTLPEYYAELVRVINSRSGITGINSWTEGSYVKLSRISTRDDDQPLTVYITPNAPNTVGVVFGEPPPLALAMTVTLPDNVPALGNAARLATITSTVAMSAQAAATVKGGNGLYSYQWLAEYVGTETGSLSGYAYNIANGLVQPQYGAYITPYTITRANDQSRVNQFNFTLTTGLVWPTLAGFGIDVQPFTVRYIVRCRVTDSAGNVATSNPCTIEFQIT